MDRFQRDEWLKPIEVAQVAKLSKVDVMRRFREGTGPRCVGRGKLRRSKASWVDAWIQNGFQQPTEARTA